MWAFEMKVAEIAKSFGVIAQLVEVSCFVRVARLSKIMIPMQEFWGHSSVGRAPALQAGGRQFESDWLHQEF